MKLICDRTQAERNMVELRFKQPVSFRQNFSVNKRVFSFRFYNWLSRLSKNVKMIQYDF